MNTKLKRIHEFKVNNHTDAQISPENILAQSEYCDLSGFVPAEGNFIDALTYWLDIEQSITSE